MLILAVTSSGLTLNKVAAWLTPSYISYPAKANVKAPPVAPPPTIRPMPSESFKAKCPTFLAIALDVTLPRACLSNPANLFTPVTVKSLLRIVLFSTHCIALVPRAITLSAIEEASFFNISLTLIFSGCIFDCNLRRDAFSASSAASLSSLSASRLIRSSSSSLAPLRRPCSILDLTCLA